MSKISVIVSGEGFSVTPAIYASVEEAALDIASELRAENVAVEAHLSRQGPRSYRAAFALHLRGHDFNADSSCENLYLAVRQAKQKMMKQLQNYRSKRGDQKKKPGRGHHPILSELSVV